MGVNAQEAPKEEDLVGKIYVGIHGARLDTDDDILTSNNVILSNMLMAWVLKLDIVIVNFQSLYYLTPT
ncbi:MAG: hypothetical protein ACI89T_002457 [Cognaticolwellia sp.]